MIARRIPFLFLIFGLVSASLFAADPPKYPFTKSPLELLDQLATADVGQVPALSADERKLLAAVWDQKAKNPDAPAKLSDDEVVDLLLLASGVEDLAARKKYRTRVAELRAECGRKLDGVDGTAARGEVLMKVAHEGAMKNGYELKQTQLNALFDSGKFNCVSSTALVYLIGTPHGFDLRPMGIDGVPGREGHAYLDLVDGHNRFVVECTCPKGFDSEGKVKRKEFKPSGQPIDRSLAVETDAVGLAAMIVENRLGGLRPRTAEDYQTFTRLQLCLAALDPAGKRTAKNVTAALTNWGLALVTAGEYETAVRFHEVALGFAPECDALKVNRRYTWVKAVEGAVAAGKDREAVDLVGRARKQLPKDGDFATAAKWFVIASYAAEKKGGWAAAVAVLNRGLAVVPVGERAGLKEERFKLARHAVYKLAEAGDFADALKLIGSDTTNLNDQQRAECGELVYDLWGRKLVKGQEWAAAVEKYADGLKEYPKSELLTNNTGYTVGLWAKKARDAKDWDEAVRIYDIGLQVVPDDRVMKQNKEYCLGMKARGK